MMMFELALDTQYSEEQKQGLITYMRNCFELAEEHKQQQNCMEKKIQVMLNLILNCMQVLIRLST